MADEQAAAATEAAVTSPLSSPSQGQEQSANSAAQAAASTETQSSQATTTEQKTDAAAGARPEGIPDSYWDATTNALKVDAAALAADLKERDDLKAFKAADDVRRGALPQSADAYKAELPADFTPPEGVEFKFDANAPELAQAKAMAHAKGWSQSDFSDALGLYASAKAAEQAQIDTARKAEVAKLGSTAPARVDAVTRWLSGIDSSADKGDAKALAGMLVTARHVEAFERIITRFSTQGSGKFSQQHRDVDTGKLSPEAYDKLSYGEKKEYAAKQSGKAN